MQNKKNPFWASVALLIVCAEFPAPAVSLPSEFDGKTPLEWSTRMADSEMARLTNAPKWDYAMGLFTLSLLKLNEQMPDERFVKFSEEKVAALVSADGKIQGYKPDEFQLDALNPGKTVLALWLLATNEASDQPRLFYACANLVRQFETQPRTFDGGFWHKQRYTNQMWLDGIYMAEPFYAAMGHYMIKPQNAYDDVAKQFRLIDQHTYDPKTGLNYHGWDAAKIQSWANPQTGCSSNFWGRAEGWYAMALVDTLDFFPTNHPARAEILAAFQKTCAGIVKWQDQKTGLWWQVMDQGDRKGNYLEATASAMFVYALAKGIKNHYLPYPSFPAVMKGYRGMIEKFVVTNATAQLGLRQCCQVAGLGFTSNGGRPRDGSFDYYVSEPVVENDLKGVGPFILAGLEVQKIMNGQPPVSASKTSRHTSDGN